MSAVDLQECKPCELVAIFCLCLSLTSISQNWRLRRLESADGCCPQFFPQMKRWVVGHSLLQGLNSQTWRHRMLPAAKKMAVQPDIHEHSWHVSKPFCLVFSRGDACGKSVPEASWQQWLHIFDVVLMAHGPWPMGQVPQKLQGGWKQNGGYVCSQDSQQTQFFVSCHSWCALTRLRLARCKHSGFDKDGNGKIDFEAGKDQRMKGLRCCINLHKTLHVRPGICGARVGVGYCSFGGRNGRAYGFQVPTSHRTGWCHHCRDGTPRAQGGLSLPAFSNVETVSGRTDLYSQGPTWIAEYCRNWIVGIGRGPQFPQMLS